MRHSSLSRFLPVFAFAALAACTDSSFDRSVDPSGPDLATETQASRVTVKLAFQGVLVTDLPIVLGCSALNGSVFIPDISGDTGGTTITYSDCRWNSSLQRCDCTVTVTQHDAH